ncbi:MAG: cysteine hydrolase [Planctomycetaceae bacterium]|nr:cysteine hydrolase [Planctomycetaceae bacterium]
MKTALLLIDIQNDYFPGGALELENTVEAANNTAKLLAAARKVKLPVIHIQHINKRPGATFFVAGTKGVEIHNSVAPIAGEKIIVKHYPNSFRDTELNKFLQEHNIHDLIICGMMSHMCVHATARAACDFGYECFVAHDACATKAVMFNNHKVSATDVHDAFMAALNGLYAQMKTTDEIASAIEAKII